MGLEGGSGTLVTGLSLIDTARFETATGAAAGRHAEKSKKAKVKSKKVTVFTDLFYTKLSRTHHANIERAALLFTFYFLLLP